MKKLPIPLLLGLFCLCLPVAAQSQAYPTKPIRMIVPYPPGGIDPYIRRMEPRMQELLGQPLVIENRAGANGIIGTETAIRSAPDGYTLLFATSSTLVGGPFITKNFPFDPLKDLTPVVNIFEATQLLAVHAKIGVNSVQELIAYAKKNPGKLSYNSSGIGSVFHLNGELFKLASGVDIVHVPYSGTGPMAQSFFSGEIEVCFPGVTNIRQFMSSGKIKVLASLETKRIAFAPDAPALAEILPGFRKTPSWIGILAPPGLARPLAERVNNVVLKTLEDPGVRAFFDQNAAQIIGGTPESFALQMREDTKVTADLVKKLGIKPE
jgi:tripartite-type tricarboxylate transporter receptor subunit TctC